MASQSFHQASAAGMNSFVQSNNPSSGSSHGQAAVDLTLRLGLPKDSHEKNNLFSLAGQYANPPAPAMNPHHAYFGYNHGRPYTPGITHEYPAFGMASGMSSSTNQQQLGGGGQMYDQYANIHDKNDPWLAPEPNYLTNSNGVVAGHQYPYNNNYGYNYYGNNNIPPPAATPLPQMTDQYILLDRHSPRTTGYGSSSSSSRRHCNTNYNDPNKRCTNFNCGTNNTPMWRKGPLGPKSLCNACGIKYRKDEERKKARDAAESSGTSSQDN